MLNGTAREPRVSWRNNDEPAVYGTLTAPAAVLNPISKRMIGDANYPGVQISYDGATVLVYDLRTRHRSG
jgi:hypothetical protein